MKKIIIALGVITPLLTGCGVGHTEYSKEAYKRADLNFVGIPTALGIGTAGSSVPISPDYSLTAAHVAKMMLYKVKAYHPTCDLALIYHKNHEKSYPVFRDSERGEEIKMYGYSYMTSMPVESFGKALGDLIIHNSADNKEPCMLTYATTGVVSGMSGGPVYNTRDNTRDKTLAGIIHGYTPSVTKPVPGLKERKTVARDVSLYVPYKNFSAWLKKEMNE